MTDWSPPTAREFAALPRRAKIAFTARCARRLLPLYRQDYGPASARLVAKLTRAVEVGEQSGAGSHVGDAVALEAIEEAEIARLAARQHPVAELVATAAYHAADCSRDGVTGTPYPAAALSICPHGFGAVVNAFLWARQVMSVELDALTRAARDHHWDDSTPVAPEFFGPLWDDERVALLPDVVAATEQLKRLMGTFGSGATIEWAFAEGEFPSGLQIQLAMPAWQLAKSRRLNWGEISDPHRFSGTLAGVWDDLLKDRIAEVRAEAGLTGTR